jgi:uncharacterized membrane protein HdeD (DUF308 family)
LSDPATRYTVVDSPAFSIGLSVLAGVVSLVLGILILLWPDETLLVVAVLFGIQLLLTGIMRIVLGAFSHGQEAWMRAIYVLTGLLVVLAGIVCLRHPVLSIAVIIVVTAIGWMVDGIALIVAGANAAEGKGPLIFLGSLTVLAAVVLLVVPVESTHALLLLGGWLLIIMGVLSILTGGTSMRTVSRTTGLPGRPRPAA